MHRLNDYYEETIAEHWLPALINADYTGLSDPEAADLAAFMRQYDRLPAVRFYFTNHALTPQQHALDLN
jgi:hypothetical protein